MPPGKPPRQSTRDLRRAWTDKRAGSGFGGAHFGPLLQTGKPIIFPVLQRLALCVPSLPIPASALQSERGFSAYREKCPSSYEFSAPLAPPIADAQGLWNIFGIAVVLHKWQGVSCC